MKKRSTASASDSSGQSGGGKHSAADARFNILPQARSKVVVDDRFSAMLTDPSFGALEVRDKYGRKGKRRVTDNVASLYELQRDVESSVGSDSQEVSNISDAKNSSATARKKKTTTSQDCDRSDNRIRDAGSRTDTRPQATSSAIHDDSVMSRLKTRDIRSAMNDWTSCSSSSSSSVSGGSSDDESDKEEYVGVGSIAAPATSIITEGEETSRLAVLHLDWDRISAKDIFAMLHSFLPSEGGLVSVTVFPSEFGKKQMAAERSCGPVVQQPKSKKKNSTESLTSAKSADGDVGADFDDDALRAYELNKLRYYYAVAEFDSPETASAVYEQCDGVEFEASSNVLDLRFIPHETHFDVNDARDTATSMPTTYEAPVFTTSALQMSKVQLTWDDDDPKRSVLKGDKHGRINYADFLASGSSSDDGDDRQSGNSSGDDNRSCLRPEKRQAYASLLNSLHKSADEEESKGIEISFAGNVQRKADSVLAAFSTDVDTASKQNKKKQKQKQKAEEADSLYVDDVEWDPNDPYHAEELQKVGEKKSKKKSMRERRLEKMAKEEARKASAADNAELQLLVEADADGRRSGGYSLKPGALDRASAVASGSFAPKQRKGGRDVGAGNADGGFVVDVDDARFSSIFTDPNYAVDPLNPLFQRTPGMQKVLRASHSKRLKHKAPGSSTASVPIAAASQQGMSAELKLLVSSVKSKAPCV